MFDPVQCRITRGDFFGMAVLICRSIFWKWIKGCMHLDASSTGLWLFLAHVKRLLFSSGCIDAMNILMTSCGLQMRGCVISRLEI